MLITPEYRAQQQHLHDTTHYGTASIQYAPLVGQIIDKLSVTHLLDYGCGKNMNLARTLFGEGQALRPRLKHIPPGEEFKYQAYDPAIPELSGAPTPAAMVACIDVLEHIEPECLDEVLDHLQTLTQGVLLVTVHTGPAMKMLPDGRNAHINQQPMEYWLPKLWARFALHTVQVTGPQAFYVIAQRLTTPSL